MKKILFYMATATIGLALLSSCGDKSASSSSESTASLSNEIDSLSYTLGVTFGNQLKEAELNEIDLDLAIQGIKDALNSTPKVDIYTAQNVVQQYMLRKMFQKNIDAGNAFLEENKAKEGVEAMPNGIQYKITKLGTGPKPAATDIVEVYYKGMLIDGTVFDTNEGSEPISFPLNQVITGWTQGLQQIPEGSKVTLYIPQELAYGANPRPGGPIEPYMTLIFDIELLKVTPQSQQ